jgi:hypothetical protein
VTIPTTLPTKDLLAISLNNLEENCQSNPQLTFVWGTELAKAKRRVKDLKSLYKVACAELEKRIRQQPQAYDLDKVTDKAVEAVITTDNECRNRLDEQQQAEYEEDILKVFMEAVSDRREELGNLTKLHGQMYWCKPDVSVPEADRVATMKAASEKVSKPNFRKNK